MQLKGAEAILALRLRHRIIDRDQYFATKPNRQQCSFWALKWLAHLL